MSGITKREPPISWRPSPAASLALADLIQRMGMKRNEVLNLIVIAAAHERGHGGSVTEPIDLEKADAAIASENERRLTQIRKALPQTSPPRPQPTGGLDRDKVLAFQNLTGMDKAPKRG